jgi:hypothetical protein
MSRSRSAFRQSDVTRAIKGAQAAGVDVAGVKVEKDGGFTVIAGKPNDITVAPATNDLDKWIAANADANQRH